MENKIIRSHQINSFSGYLKTGGGGGGGGEVTMTLPGSATEDLTLKASITTLAEIIVFDENKA